MTTPRGFDELVAAVSPRVLDEALERAVAQARDELSDRLARAIVDRALAGRAAAAAPPAAEPAPASAAEPRPGTGLYAFAIIPARPVDLAGVAGIDGEAPLRIVQHGELGLLVSPMRLSLMDDVSEDDLSETGALAVLARRHDEVVRAVFEHGPVLPLRFGTVVADEDGARRLLAEQAPAAKRRLAHLDARREWGVRLSRDPATADEQPDADRTDRRDMTGTSYLAARREALTRAQRAEQQTAAVAQQVQDALGAHAADLADRGGGAGSGLLADLAYLVPAEQEDAFLQDAQRLAGEVAGEGLVLDVTGPWPPYSFAGLGAADAGVAGSA